MIADASGGGHDGTAVGQVVFGQKGMLDREPDTALVFDGKSACVEIPSDAAFSQPTSGAGFSVEAWMRPDALEFIGEGEEGYVNWLGKGEAGKWMHIVAVFDPGDATNPKAGVSIYKDGKLAGNPATSPGALYKAYDVMPVAGTAPLRLGTRDKKNFFTGGIDEVAIYPRALAAREIADNYRAGRVG